MAGGHPHARHHRRDARAHDALARDHHAALLAHADPAVQAARRAARAVAQRDCGRRRSGRRAMLCPAGARSGVAVDLEVDHVAASSTGANRSGEYHSSGSGLVAPVAQAATNSPVAGANPMPAPSWPVATQMFGASPNGPMIGT